MLRKTLFATAPLMGAAIITKTEEKPKDDVTPDADKSLVCRPSDLPIYPRAKVSEKHHPHSQSKSSSAVEEGVRAVRVEVQNVTNSIAAQKQSVSDFIEKGKAHSACMFIFRLNIN